MKEGLKGCPFCGRAVEMFYSGSSDWSIDCECGFHFFMTIRGGNEPEEAKIKWNDRFEEMA
jgi:hypothetical protein